MNICPQYSQQQPSPPRQRTAALSQAHLILRLWLQRPQYLERFCTCHFDPLPQKISNVLENYPSIDLGDFLGYSWLTGAHLSLGLWSECEREGDQLVVFISAISLYWEYPMETNECIGLESTRRSSQASLSLTIYSEFPRSLRSE